MKQYLRMLVGTTAGGLAGACLVSVPLTALTFYHSGSNLYLPLVSLVGMWYGAVLGSIIGLIVMLCSRDKKTGALVGAVSGLIIVVLYLGWYNTWSLGLPSEINYTLRREGLLAAAVGTLIGIVARASVERIITARAK